MSERSFRFVISIVLLFALYFEAVAIVLAVAILYIFEGATNWRIPVLVTRLRGVQNRNITCDPGAIALASNITLEAERVLRLFIGIVLAVSLLAFPETTWFLPWLIAFALLVAAITGVCPCIWGLKQYGFK